MSPHAIHTIVAGVATPDADDPTLLDAAALARATGAELHLVHAFEGPGLGIPLPAAHSGPPHDRDSREVRLRARLREAAAAVAPAVTARAWVFQASPGAAVLEVARKLSPELIVVGASHRSRVGQAVLGTAAQRVIRGSPAPVLVLREPFLRPLRRVLLTSDLSARSAGVHEAGLDLVEALFAGDRPEVTSLTVIPAGVVPPPLPREVLLHAAATELEGFLAARRPRGHPVRAAVRLGVSADEIVRAAEEVEADLLVLGTQARHGVERIFVGSVAESALARARCNTLVIPPLSAHPEPPAPAPLLNAPM